MKDFLDVIYTDHEISNTKINKILSGIPYYQGCYSKSELINLPKKIGSYIINMENAFDENGNGLPGTHWCSLFVGTEKCLYIDSFGVIYPTEVKDFCQDKILNYNKTQIQSLDSSCCGYYEMYFVDMITNGNTLKACLDPFYKTLFDLNDEILLKYYLFHKK